MFQKNSSESYCFCLKPTAQCTFTERILCWIVCLNIYIMFWKISSENHCFCLKPTTQCTFTERIHCSIVCLNMYNVLKNLFCEPLLLVESHLSVYFHRAHTLFNCMFECVYCFEKILLKAITSSWSPLLNVLSQSAYFVELYAWIYIMFWKISSENHCFWLNPTFQFTFTERIHCSIVCLNVYIVLKKFFWRPLLLLEAHCSMYFQRAHTLLNCMLEYI